MRKHIPKWLNNETLKAMPDASYDGTIASVDPQSIFNKWKGEQEWQVVIFFADGYQWIPSPQAKKALHEWFGGNIKNYVGKRIHIACTLERWTNGKEVWVKTVSRASTRSQLRVVGGTETVQ